MAKIRHDAEAFLAEISMRVYDESLTDAIDVITRDGDPKALLAIVRSSTDFNVHYTNGKDYTTYQHAFAAIGAAIDRVNPDHRPLNDRWTS